MLIELLSWDGGFVGMRGGASFVLSWWTLFLVLTLAVDLSECA